MGPSVYVNGSRGKTCPNGHWNHLGRIVTASDKINPQKAASRKTLLGALVTTPILRFHGLNNQTEQLLVALQWWVDNYDRLMLQFPEGTAINGLMQGMFKNIHTMSKRMVYGEMPVLLKIPED